MTPSNSLAMRLRESRTKFGDLSSRVVHPARNRACGESRISRRRKVRANHAGGDRSAVSLSGLGNRCSDYGIPRETTTEGQRKVNWSPFRTNVLVQQQTNPAPFGMAPPARAADAKATFTNSAVAGMADDETRGKGPCRHVSGTYCAKRAMRRMKTHGDRRLPSAKNTAACNVRDFNRTTFG